MAKKDDESLLAQLAKVEPWSKYRDKALRLRSEFGSTTRYKTEWGGFNQYIGGGFGSSEHGELVVVMGDTGVGKSTFVANLAVHMLATTKETIHYITLENTPEEMYNIMLNVMGRENLGEFEGRFTSPSRKLIFDGPAWSAEHLIRHMEYVAGAYNRKLFILDHLNFMFENEEQAANELVRTRVVMRRLSRFCMNYDATVFAISHINKKPETKGRSGQYLTLDRIYGSQAIAGAATKVLALNPVRGNGRLIDVQMLKTRYTPNRGDSIAQFEVEGYEWHFQGTSNLDGQDT